MDYSAITRVLFSSFLLSLLLLSFQPTPSLAKSVHCNKNDYTTLMKIKAAFGNTPYYFSSWVSNTDCCDWYGVECDSKSNRVVALSFVKANITGQIPAEVGDLPYLNTLIFHHVTNLTGNIPSSITKLKLLTTLWFSWANLSGPIPSFISQLPNLDYINLSFNQFSGSIPSSFSDLSKLSYLELSRNRLTGGIPESFGKFKQSMYLKLSHNQLSGEVPKSLGNVHFITIDLGRNKLQGDALMLFKANGSNGWSQTIDLDRNLFEFDLSKMEINKELIYLDISHNKIYGSIPEALTGLDLQFFNVSYNRLCGKIPQGGSLQNYDSYSFYHNKCLCGSPLAACK